MSEFKFKDTLQLRRPEELKTLTKTQRHRIMDDALSESAAEPGKAKGLKVQLGFSNGGKRINGRIYAPIAQLGSVPDWTEPYKKRVLKHHDSKQGEPLGYVTDVEHIVYTDKIKPFIPDSRARRKFMQDVQSNSPQRIQKALNRHDLYANKKWPGATELSGWTLIRDEEGIDKFLKGLYDTVSASASSSYMACGTCGSNWVVGDRCDHPLGQMMDEEDGRGFHMLIAMKYHPREISVVNIPGNDTSFVKDMELLDSDGNDVVKQWERDHQKRWSFSDIEGFSLADMNIEISEDAMKFDIEDLLKKVKEAPIEDAETVLSDAFGNTQLERQHLIMLHDAMHQRYDWDLKYGDRSEMDRTPAAVYAYHGKIHAMSVEGEYRDSMMNGELDFYNDKGAYDDKNPYLSDGYRKKKKQQDAAMIHDSAGEATEGIQSSAATSTDNESSRSADMDSKIWVKLDTALRVQLNKDNAEFADEAFVGDGKTFPIEDAAAVAVARQVVDGSDLDDEAKAKVKELIDAREQALKDANVTVESLIADYKRFGLSDELAHRAAVLHLVRETDLSDEERAALFQPKTEQVDDAELTQLKEDYAQLVKDHEQLTQDHASIKAERDELLQAKESPEEVNNEDGEQQQSNLPEKVESPAASGSLEDEAKSSGLSPYQQRVITLYEKRLKDSKEDADAYLRSITHRLPEDFDITKHVQIDAA